MIRNSPNPDVEPTDDFDAFQIPVRAPAPYATLAEDIDANSASRKFCHRLQWKKYPYDGTFLTLHEIAKKAKICVRQVILHIRHRLSVERILDKRLRYRSSKLFDYEGQWLTVAKIVEMTGYSRNNVEKMLKDKSVSFIVERAKTRKRRLILRHTLNGVQCTAQDVANAANYSYAHVLRLLRQGKKPEEIVALGLQGTRSRHAVLR